MTLGLTVLAQKMNLSNRIGSFRLGACIFDRSGRQMTHRGWVGSSWLGNPIDLDSLFWRCHEHLDHKPACFASSILARLVNLWKTWLLTLAQNSIETNQIVFLSCSIRLYIEKDQIDSTRLVLAQLDSARHGLAWLGTSCWCLPCYYKHSKSISLHT